LRQFVRRQKGRARVIAVTSGKGGVGKTSISVNLSIALSRRGQQVVLLDADLGLANVEVLLGLNSLYTLQQVVQGVMSMRDILVEGPGGIRVVPGSSGISRIADLGPKARQNILTGLDDLQDYADIIIIDTMAGIGQNAVAFAAAADEVLLVCTPEPSSIVDAYAMIKTISMMRDDAVFRLVVNQALNEQQARVVAAKLDMVASQYLGRKLPWVGYVPRDLHVSRGVMQSTPFLIQYPNAMASKHIVELAAKLLNLQPESAPSGRSFLRRFAENLGLASSA
jgi:flagellar biosynthesis protein FlhG